MVAARILLTAVLVAVIVGPLVAVLLLERFEGGRQS